MIMYLAYLISSKFGLISLLRKLSNTLLPTDPQDLPAPGHVALLPPGHAVLLYLAQPLCIWALLMMKQISSDTCIMFGSALGHTPLHLVSMLARAG